MTLVLVSIIWSDAFRHSGCVCNPFCRNGISGDNGRKYAGSRTALIYGLNSFTLLAVPLFILVGNLMDFGGISKRLTDWAKSILGWLPGGLGIVTVFSCAILQR